MSAFLGFGHEAQLHNFERYVTVFPPKLMAIISSASPVDCAVIICLLAPMLMGSLLRKKREPEVDMRMYMKAVDASGSRSSCAESADPAAGFARDCPSAIMSV